MKISNSKKQLAQLLIEAGVTQFPDGANWAAQDGDKGVDFFEMKPVRDVEWWQGDYDVANRVSLSVKIPNWHQTVLSRDEYLHLYPAPVKVVVENKTTCHLTVTEKPTIEQLAADYRNRKDYADRKQQEADAAKADADAKLAELVAAGKVHGLVLSVTDTGPALVINDWRDLLVGDEVEYISGTVDDYAGAPGVVSNIDNSQACGTYRIRVTFQDGRSLWCGEWRFIRRPVKGGADA